jgi:hypothetical protein
MSQAIRSVTSTWMDQPFHVPSTRQDPFAVRTAPPPRQRNVNIASAESHRSPFSGPQFATPGNHNMSNIVLSPGLPHKILIDGYSQPAFGKIELAVPPLQHRRTLDHYLYSHLSSITRRDRNQVIQKFTSWSTPNNAKMFMVDQLWLWILDNGT